MLYQEDSNRLVQSHHDLAAVEELKVSLPAEERELLERRRQRWQQEQEALVKALQDSRREREETANARFGLESKGRLLDDWYVVVHRELNGSFTHPRPSEKIPADVLAARRLAAARVASLPPSKFTEQSVQVRALQLAEIVHELSTNPALAPIGLDPELAQLVQDAAQAKSGLDRERNEDSAAQEALDAARLRFDRQRRSYALAVESVLVETDREGEIGRWLLARDPSFRARRESRAPLTSEPNAAAVAERVGESLSDEPAGPLLSE